MTEHSADLAIRGITKRFGGVVAVDSLDLVVRQGSIAGIIGPNGAGKTTVFNVVTGFLRPDGGSVCYMGHDLASLPPYQVAYLGVSRTFQDLRLIRQMTVLDNATLAASTPECETVLTFLRRRCCGRAERTSRERAREWLEFVGLQDHERDIAGEISYGQQKLLSVACCLATGAGLLLLDEPVAGISPMATESLMQMIMRLPALGKTILFIEHNLQAVRSMADTVVVMDAGRKIAEGTWDEVSAENNVLEAYLA